MPRVEEDPDLPREKVCTLTEGPQIGLIESMLAALVGVIFCTIAYWRWKHRMKSTELDSGAAKKEKRLMKVFLFVFGFSALVMTYLTLI